MVGVVFQLWIEELAPSPSFFILCVDAIFDALSWLFNVVIKAVASASISPHETELPDLKSHKRSKAMLQFIWVA